METARSEDNRWFAPADRNAPRDAFDDVTMVTELSDPDIEIVEAEPEVLPAPAQRTTTPLPQGQHQDQPFAELNAIVTATREILTGVLTETELDAFEWKLRQKVARL